MNESSQQVLRNFFQSPTDEGRAEVEKLYLADPVSTWVMVQTGAAVIGAVAGIVSAVNTNRQLKEIMKKLNEVIALQKDILNEIRALKVYFNEALYTSFLNDVTKDLQAQSMRYEAIIDGLNENETQLPEREIGRLNSLLLEVEQTSFKLLAYGPASYQSLGIAMVLLKSLYGILKVNEGSQKATFKIFANKMQDWLNNTDIGLYEYKAETITAIDKNKVYFVEATKPKRVIYREYEGITLYLHAKGTLEVKIVLLQNYILRGSQQGWEKAETPDRWGIYKKAQELKNTIIVDINNAKRVEDIIKHVEDFNSFAKSWSNQESS